MAKKLLNSLNDEPNKQDLVTALDALRSDYVVERHRCSDEEYPPGLADFGKKIKEKKREAAERQTQVLLEDRKLQDIIAQSEKLLEDAKQCSVKVIREIEAMLRKVRVKKLSDELVQEVAQLIEKIESRSL